ALLGKNLDDGGVLAHERLDLAARDFLHDPLLALSLAIAWERVAARRVPFALARRFPPAARRRAGSALDVSRGAA
ncbi:MAG TPA: hypothetical protein VIG55_05350, partial [Methylosinus sp.]